MPSYPAAATSASTRSDGGTLGLRDASRFHAPKLTGALPTRRAKAAQAYSGGVTLIVAHRGASAIAPENSLEAFEAAIAVGADMVEFDVRSTADGVLVVVHDPLPLVRYADLDPMPPRLEEVVATCAGRIALDVELKEAGMEREV